MNAAGIKRNPRWVERGRGMWPGSRFPRSQCITVRIYRKTRRLIWRVRLRVAERAVQRSFDAAASRRIDVILDALDRIEAEVMS